MTTEETELTFVRCPNCRSLIPAIATRCRMCGTQFDKKAEAGAPPEAPAADAQKQSRVRQRTISASSDEVESIKRAVEDGEPQNGSSESFRLGGARAEEVRPPAPPIRAMEPPVDESEDDADDETDSVFDDVDDSFLKVDADVEPDVASDEAPVGEDSDEEWSDEGEDDDGDDAGEGDDSAPFSQPARPEGKRRRRRRRKKRQAAPAEGASLDAAPQEQAAPSHVSHMDRPSAEPPRREEPRQPEPPRFSEPPPRAAEPRHEQRHSDPRQGEPRHSEPRHSEPRHSESRHSEPRQSEPRHSEPRNAEPRHAEPRHEPHARHGGEARQPAGDGALIGWLVDFSGDSKGAGIELRAGKFFVGRQKLRGNDLVLSHQSISTPHCMIVSGGNDPLSVQDLMSENGTFIRREGGSYNPVVGTAPLEHGDWLKLGDFELLVCLVPKSGRSRR